MLSMKTKLRVTCIRPDTRTSSNPQSMMNTAREWPWKRPRYVKTRMQIRDPNVMALAMATRSSTLTYRHTFTRTLESATGNQILHYIHGSKCGKESSANYGVIAILPNT